MKKSFLLVLLCMLASVLPAQKKMYVWVNEVPTEYSVSDVDSVTFADALPTPEPEPLNGVFSVSEDKQVQFSCGNLQYTQSTQTWSFADRQYEAIGKANVADGALADKIDLFGWSGSTGTATAKWGISTSTSNADYSGDFADWGQNIGNGTTWRTLTNNEWTYLLDTRTNASALKGVARINLNADGSEYVNGLILLPDNWTTPDGVTFKSGFTSESGSQAYADYQTFMLDQWQTLEQAGAVFLPASGYRSGSAVYNVPYNGRYWSATYPNPIYAYYLNFNSGGASTSNYNRYYGYAVRLVKDVE